MTKSGGNAMIPENIFVTRPHLPPLGEFLPYLEEIWRSRILTNAGAMHERLEEALCAYLGVTHLTLFCNATIALIAAMRQLGVSGEVITTPYSFAATAHSIVWAGATPVFADVDAHTMNLTPSSIEAAITERTRAIMPVHCYGRPCDVEAIADIAARHGLKVIYDAAHAFGVRDAGGSVLRHGDLSVLSFHATKVFSTIEGGAIVSRDAQTKQALDRLKDFGIADETTVDAIGVNGKLNEIGAAFGLMQLQGIDEALRRRRRIDGRYRELLGATRGIAIPEPPEGVQGNCGYFPVLVKPEFGMNRDALHAKLAAQGVHARRYFYPLISDFPVYRSLPSAALSNLPAAREAADQVLCLPIYPDLADEEVERVVSIIGS